ncbi:hypothetical protein [Burkholderia sp. Ac-20365]|uniref:hypothetical protein n=1 Tax=Burkholderia sp. Ac-20365 TaxID=2703897 RepID=UPI00197B79BA|nr:hypothetical protein [Burkholderia sp. Ac-20365]MBN3760982.1 hypothetical protein [Burkholderia sp. Ac-20365]
MYDRAVARPNFVLGLDTIRKILTAQIFNFVDEKRRRTLITDGHIGPIDFYRVGLAFGYTHVAHVGTGIEHRAVSNASGRTWSVDDRPWGHAGESAHQLASDVVWRLRPDWQDSFWSWTFFDDVCRSFVRAFLLDAAAEGGHVTAGRLQEWMRDEAIGRPAWATR